MLAVFGFIGPTPEGASLLSHLSTSNIASEMLSGLPRSRFSARSGTSGGKAPRIY